MITEAFLVAALFGGSGMGLAISPAQVTGQPSSTAQFTYTDKGTTVESVRVQAVELKPVMVAGKRGWSPYGEADYATVSPERFTIRPGHKQVITVKMNATDGKLHNVAILSTADGNSTVAGGRISASVGARYIVSAPLPSSGLPIAPIAALAGLSVALIAAWALLRRRSRRNRPTENPYGFLP
jgi:hypothetical protein